VPTVRAGNAMFDVASEMVSTASGAKASAMRSARVLSFAST
jgi:hypothetical protein